LSTAQKADRRARRYIRFHAFQSEEKRDARQEFKNSRVKEFRSSGGKYRWVRTNTGVEYIAHRMEADE